MIRKVFDISENNLADVPGRLRDLADQIERFRLPLRACVVVLDPVTDPIDVRAFGRDADLLRTIGLLHTAATDLSTTVMARAYADEPPSPAA